MSGPVAESKRIAAKLDKKQDQWQQGTSLRLEGEKTDTYPVQPARYYERDDRDDRMKMKQIVTKGITDGSMDVENLPMIGNNVPVTDSDIQYLLDQRTKEEKFQFDRWKYQSFKPGTDPVRLQYFQKIDPQFFKEREREIDKDFDLVEKLALLVLNGVESEDDVMLLYAMSTGKVKEPYWKIYFPYSWLAKDGDLTDFGKNKQMRQGYFNPRQYASERTKEPLMDPNIYKADYLKPAYGGSDIYTGRDMIGPGRTNRPTDFWTRFASNA